MAHVLNNKQPWYTSQVPVQRPYPIDINQHIYILNYTTAVCVTKKQNNTIINVITEMQAVLGGYNLHC